MKTQKMKMKQMVMASLVIFAGASASAQSSSPEVFRRIDKNIENAEANKADSVRNLGIINGNITAVGKAKTEVTGDSAKIKAEMAANSKTMTDIDRSLEGAKKAESLETRALDAEAKKIAELEEHIKKLQLQMEARQKNLDSIRAEREKLEAAQSEWKGRGEELVRLNAEVQVREQRVNAEEKEWAVKKVRFEKDIERWNKSLETQDKLRKKLTSLKK